MVTVFSVYLSSFYTHLNAITIENFPLNMVIKNHTHLYRLFRKWITRHVTFNWHQLYIILKFTIFSVHLNGFLHPSQRNYYRKSYLEHIAFSGSE